MKITRILLLGCLLAAFAAPVFANEEPIVYTVKPGDTLWGISQRFIKDPYYWPNLWSHNPAIGNPHLIYPGQTLYIYDGRIEIVPAIQPAAETLAEGAETPVAAPAAARSIEVKVHGAPRSFVLTEELPTLGTLIDTTENRFLMYEGDTVFLEMDDLAAVTPGQQLKILEMGKKVTHPVTSELIGFQVSEMGRAEVTGKTGDVAVAVIRETIREVQRGAKVRPYAEFPATVMTKPATVATQGVVLTSDSENETLSIQDVIHVDLGSAAGLEVGNELMLYRTRVFTKSARPIKQLDADNFVELPDIDLGRAVVIAVREKTAAALVTSVTNLPLYRGDLVKTVLP
jgi:LysM repeat protein